MKKLESLVAVHTILFTNEKTLVSFLYPKYIGKNNKVGFKV